MSEETVGAVAAPVPQKKSPLVMIIVVAVAAIMLGGGGAYFFFKPKDGEKKPGEHAVKEGEGAATVQEEGVLSLEPFIVNLADADEDRYVKCTLRLVVDTQAAAEHVKSKEIAITRVRDRILTLLSGKKYLEIATPEGKEALRAEISGAVGEVLENGKITAVYYSEFIVQ
jgi:flagellar FliL protein